MLSQLVHDSVCGQIKAFAGLSGALRFMIGMVLIVMVTLTLSPLTLLAKETNPSTPLAPPSSLSLSVSETVSLFLKENLDLLMTKYGIDDAKGMAITARLFPNPVFSLFGGAAFSQQQTFKGTRYLTPQIEQMFLLAGKRGYRIESAGYGIQAAEATFTDAIRQLTLTSKTRITRSNSPPGDLISPKITRSGFIASSRLGNYALKKALLPKWISFAFGYRR